MPGSADGSTCSTSWSPTPCVYLEHKQGFESIPWDVVTDARPDEQICLIVPMVVLDELDTAKRGPKRGRAGYTLNRLRQAIPRPGHPTVLRPAQPAAAGQPWTPATDLLVDLILEDPDHVRLPSNDEEIISCALGVARTASPSRVDATSVKVHVVTFDHAMAFRVRGKQGIHEVLLPDEDKQDQPERVSAPGEGTGARAQRRQRRATEEVGASVGGDVAADVGESQRRNDDRDGG